MEERSYYLQVEGQKDWKDQLSALHLSIATPIGWLTTASAYLFFGISLLFSLVAQNTTAIFISGIMLAAYLWLFFSPRFRIRRNFEKDPTSKDPITLTVSEQGIEYSSETQKGEWHWKAITRWRSNDEVTLLYLPSRAFITIPHRLIKEEETIAALRDLLEQHELPEYRGPIGAQIVGILFFLSATMWVVWPVIDYFLK